MKSTVAILMYAPTKNVGRINLRIPHKMLEERPAFKKLNGFYHHPQQPLWSIPNTAEHWARVVALFGKKLQEMPCSTPHPLPAKSISEKAQIKLDKHYQKMNLKGFYESTIRIYQNNLALFFACFENSGFSGSKRINTCAITIVSLHNYYFG